MANQYELNRADQIYDVRPWGTRMAEKLSDPFLLSLVVGGILAIMFLAPLTLPITLTLLLVVLISSRGAASHLPVRYPPGANDPETGKPGNGIWFLGNMVYEKKSEDRLPLESAFDAFKETWFSDDDLRKHLLILGSTGSGKSELLKGIFFCSLCWGSGFFVADGKADNKLPLDNYNMARFFGRDDDLLTLNFLLAGKSPAQVRNSRRRRTNKTNPFSTGDADTIIQMGANLLPKAEGDSKNWQEKALNCWRGLVPALCWLRDNESMEISATTLVEYLSLAKIEELYIKGFVLAQENKGVWLDEFTGVKAYLEVGVPGFKVDRCLRKYNVGPPAKPSMTGKAEPTDQDSGVYDQHGYRATQLNPALGLLGKTYGHIFQDKYSEIDMVDVTLNNRILILLIPSLEKSAQEAESLGKLTVACLRVMMGRSLGAEIEGTRAELLDSKSTEAPYPYVVALDELGYYFADGIAVMFAQARSLGFCMIAAAQDIEKLTEGSRAAEAGAMLANQVCKVFMRIDDANKTNEMIQKYLGKVNVALKQTYEFNDGFGYKRVPEVKVEEIPIATLTNLAKLKAGRAILNTMGKTFKIASFYVGDFLAKHPSQTFHVNRFLQIRGLTAKEVTEGYGERGETISLPIDVADDKAVKGIIMQDYLTGKKATPDLRKVAYEAPYAHKHDMAIDVVNAVAETANKLAPNVVGVRRAIALYKAARLALDESRKKEAKKTLDLQQGAEAGTVLKNNHETNKSENLSHNEEFVSVEAAAIPAALQPTSVGVNTGANILFGSGSGSIEPPTFVHDDDPFAFLNESRPLQRKPMAEVFGATSNVSTYGSEEAGEGKILEDVREVLSEIGLREEPTVSVLTKEESVAPELPQVIALGLAQMISNGLGIDLKRTTQAPIEDDRTASVRAAADAAWIGAALKTSHNNAIGRGDTVMGFTQETRAAFVRVEKALSSPNPGESVAAIERLVSNQTTPTPMIAAVDFDDIDAFLNSAESDGANSV